MSAPSPRRRFRLDPLAVGFGALLLLVFGLAPAKPVFALLFPWLERPLYEQDSFLALVVAHLTIVGLSSGAAIVIGGALGVFVTRPVGREFRGLVDSVVAIGQTMPPVAALAIAVPFMGFGLAPALVALFLYGLLPIVEGTIAGLNSVPASVVEAGRGMGWSALGLFVFVEIPLAAPVILSGVRTSVIINIGTAAIASTVGVKTLGSPIIVGLSGFNTAYVVQGALVIGALAVVADLAFERLTSWSERWKTR